MKVLLSSYSCEPDKGSEPGVGWNWANELSNLGHEVWVITRKNNKEAINLYMNRSEGRNGRLEFIYYDCPRWILSVKKRVPFGVYIYYLLWQLGAFFEAKKWHKQVSFEIVHHITFGVIRLPSFMGGLGIRFIIGPIGGGERCPIKLRKFYPIRGKVLDIIRDISNLYLWISPLMNYTYASADCIFAKTEESKNKLPIYFRRKTKVQIEIGITCESNVQISRDPSKQILNVLYVGRYIYWKGMDLGIRGFAKFAKKHKNVKLTFVGNGPEGQRWFDLSRKLQISEKIDWVGWVNREKLNEIYQSHDILLFPSLHDSSGNVILEAGSFGVPTMCLNLGGPGTIVNEKSGIIIRVADKSVYKIVDEIAHECEQLYQNIEKLKKLKYGALKYSKLCSWQNVVRNLYKEAIDPS